jgi:hypothetical protein
LIAWRNEPGPESFELETVTVGEAAITERFEALEASASVKAIVPAYTNGLVMSPLRLKYRR